MISGICCTKLAPCFIWKFVIDTKMLRQIHVLELGFLNYESRVHKGQLNVCVLGGEGLFTKQLTAALVSNTHSTLWILFLTPQEMRLRQRGSDLNPLSAMHCSVFTVLEKFSHFIKRVTDLTYGKTKSWHFPIFQLRWRSHCHTWIVLLERLTFKTSVWVLAWFFINNNNKKFRESWLEIAAEFWPFLKWAQSSFVIFFGVICVKSFLSTGNY